MYSLVFFGLLAFTAAAPSYRHHYPPPPHHEYNFDNFFKDQMFDTRRLWEDLRRDMLNLETVLADMSRRFPTEMSSARFDGTSYIVTIPLSGFEEKNIVVKARKGLLMVQAVKGDSGYMQNTYMDVRSLPDYVNEAGSWTYQNNVLKIVFPVTQTTPTERVDAITETVTATPDFSREEMENHSEEGKADVDVGVARGDQNVQDRGDLGHGNVDTNKIQNFNNVEATTYAVDLKDEVEFVPVSYR